MPFDLIEKGATAGGGGILGALLGFFGVKSKIDSVDKRVNDLTKVVQFEKTCEATHKGVDDKFETIHNLMKETRDGVKELLKK